MRNNKTILIIGVVLVVLVFFFLTRNKTTTENQTPDTTTNNTVTEEKTTVFDSIKDAMSKSLSLKCEYTASEGSVVAYIKGSSIRMDNLGGNNKSGSAIIKDNKLWTWANDSDEGVVIPIPTPEEGKVTNSEQIINDLEKEKQYCTPTFVDDSVFVPPTNIKFQDLGKMMEQLTGIVQPR